MSLDYPISQDRILSVHRITDLVELVSYDSGETQSHILTRFPVCARILQQQLVKVSSDILST